MFLEDLWNKCSGRKLILVLFFALPTCVLIGKWFAGEVPITISIQLVVVHVGDQVTLSCQLTDSIPSKMRVLWYKKEKGRDAPLCSSSILGWVVEQCQDEEQWRIVGHWQRRTLLLVIRQVQITDKGTYVCAVNGSVVTQEATTHRDVTEFRMACDNADDIKVDADTAHPNVSIAVDKKSFMHKSEAQKVTQNEGSFHSFVCVVGSESFSSGKHYWEVDVEKSNDWDLGVARKSALSPEEGFWALGFSFKRYWARTEPWTRLAVRKNPRKVGVYLNCEEKILTFFNVTDMSVMFTFKDCAFSEEVYPLFKNSHEESTMRICSVKEE